MEMEFVSKKGKAEREQWVKDSLLLQRVRSQGQMTEDLELLQLRKLTMKQLRRM